MSSTAFSQLTLELKAPWAMLAGLTGWLILLAVCIWRSDASIVLQFALTVTLLVLGLPVLATQLFGIAPWALHRACLLADGNWRLSDGRGRHWPATLVGGRSIRGCAVLIWKSGFQRHWAVVVRHRGIRDAFRRLRVRLHSMPV